MTKEKLYEHFFTLLRDIKLWDEENSDLVFQRSIYIAGIRDAIDDIIKMIDKEEEK